ncbi:MAG TPA: FAD-dependent oxidoreductase [Thermoanaerobaculaceae bacterium]|nr:FAD-dependent oxidoreductase [Thermoanaerobaculaceae bacterium]
MAVRVVIVGSGIAGLASARSLAAGGAEVTVVSAGQAGRDGASHRLHGMAPYILLAAPWVKGDSPGLFACELERRAEGLARPGLAEILAAQARDAARELMDLLELSPIADGPVLLPGEEVPRGLPVLPARSGALMAPAVESCRRAGVRFEEHALAVGLQRRGEAVCGLVVIDRGRSGLRTLEADAVVLACGGPGGAFALSTGPRWCCGSGLVLGELAGALLHEPGLVQALPLTVRPPGFFLSSRVLLDARLCAGGEALQHDGSMAGLLAAIRRARLAGRPVSAQLPASAYAALPSSFPLCALAPPGGTVELSVGCHHGIGGVAIDAWGRTSVPGLYACGEAAGGVQGRRRMMGTGLLEGWVFGRRAAAAALRDGARRGVASGAVSHPTVTPLAGAAEVEAELDAAAERWLLGAGVVALPPAVESERVPGAFDEYLVAIRHRALALLARAGRV